MAQELDQNKRTYGFRLIREEDVEWARLLHNDPDVLSMLKDPTPVAPDTQKRWYEGLKNSAASKRIVVSCNGERMGIVRLDEIDPHNRSAAVGLDIHRDFRGKGHATPIYAILLDYCFHVFDLHRCWLDVASFNEVAYRLYQKLGFVEEGRARKMIYRFGAYHDYVKMGMLKEEYLAMPRLHEIKNGLSFSFDM